MCAKGIPVLMMDLKGDLSGIAKAGCQIQKLKNDMHHYWNAICTQRKQC
jgi:hypothetical protein